MIHPSYTELINVLNANKKPEEPEIESRYSLVIAAARRARQLVNEQEPLADKVNTYKPLSIAVEEIREGKIHITKQGEDSVINYGNQGVREFALPDQEDGSEDIDGENGEEADENSLWSDEEHGDEDQENEDNAE